VFASVLLVMELTLTGEGMAFDAWHIHQHSNGKPQFICGVWFLGKNLITDDFSWFSLATTGPLNFFVAGYCYLNAYQRYQAYFRSFEPPAPTDSGVNWSRDGF